MKPKTPPLAALPLLTLALGGCASMRVELPFFGSDGASAKTAAPAGIVNFFQAGLFATRTGRPELGVTLENASTQTVWAAMRVRSPNGSDDCAQIREIAPQAKQTFACPLRQPQPDADYKVEVEPFRDAALSQPLAKLNTTLRFTPGDLKEAGTR